MGTSALPLPPFCPCSTLPFLTVGVQPRSCSPGSAGGPIQGPAPLLALTDPVLALGPHFSHYAGALVDLMGQGIWPWDCDLLEPGLELYGALVEGGVNGHCLNFPSGMLPPKLRHI